MHRFERLERILEAGYKAAKTNVGRSQIDRISLRHEGYAEPDYHDPKSGVIAFGNWNAVSEWDERTRQSVAVDQAPCRVAKLLERLGVELEWEDEWTCCDQCGKAVRTKPNSYRWQPYYAENEFGDTTCGDCIKSDPAEYLKSLEGRCDTCLTIDLDPQDHGYVLVEDNFAYGLYGGQSADPTLIRDALIEQGIERFLFSLDLVRQFDMEFWLLIHEEEIAKFDREMFDSSSLSGPDPAVQLKKALADSSAQMAALPDVAGYPKVSKCDLGTGTARSRLVSPQEFIDGKALHF